MFKRLMICLFSAALIFCAIANASADTPLCTVRVTLPGGNLTLYRIGSFQPNGTFLTEGEFAEWEGKLSDLQSPALAATLAEFADTHNCTGSTQTLTSTGTLVFADLQPGLYLFVQTQAAEGYEIISPFQVILPGLENGTPVYEVDATPKFSLTPSPTEPETTDPSLPQTGQLKWPVPLLTVSGLVLLAAGLYFLRRKSHG